MAKASSTKQKVSDYISNPFSITFKGLGLLVDFAKSTFIALVVLSVLGTGFNVIGDVIDTTQSNNNDFSEIQEFIEGREINASSIEVGDILSVGVFTISLIVTVIAFAVLIGTLFNTLINGTVAAAANSAVEEKEITLGQAIRQMADRFGVLYLALLVATMKTIGGYLLFIVPGIRAQLRYTALPYLIMSDKKLSADGAIDACKNLYKGHLMEVFGIQTVGGIIPFVGSSLSAGGLALSHKQLTQYRNAGMQTPKTHWLNYIGFILFAVFIVLIGLFGLVIFSLVN